MTPIGFTVISPPRLTVFPILFALRTNRIDWTLQNGRDAIDPSFNAGAKCSIQVNAFDTTGNVYQGVLWVDYTLKRLAWFMCVVNPQQEVLFTSSPSGKEIPYFDLFRDLGDEVQLNLSEKDENGSVGFLISVYRANTIYFSDAAVFPANLQPSLKNGFGAGIVGFGNGSQAIFTDASFAYRLNENGAPPVGLFVVGGCGSSETNNLQSNDVTVTRWQNGAEIKGSFTA